MKLKKGLLWGLVVFVAGCAAFAFFTRMTPHSAPQDRPAQHIANPEAPSQRPAGEKTFQATRDKGSRPGADTVDAGERQALIDTLTDMYKDHISHPRIQLEALQKLIRFLKEKYPDTWQDHVSDYLNAAFPEFAEDLINRFEQLEAYSRWADENRQQLSDLPLYEIHDMIWEKRLEIFGDEALVIWEMELKQKEVDQLTAEIQTQSDKPLSEKLDYYNQQIDGIYGEIAGAYKRQHQQELINTFLGIEGVQDDLHAMNEAERKTHLTDLRKTMGLDEDALTRWSELDDHRDERWRRGMAYMKARDAVLRMADDAEKDEQLARLRSDYFGDEADVIGREEQSGLYRFTRKRLYGKN